MYCPYCGTLNSDEANFCTKCKKPLSVQYVKPVKKKRGVLKVLLTIFLTLLAFFCIVGYFGSKKSETVGTKAEQPTSANSSIKAERVTKKDGVIGNYVVLLKDAKVVKSTYDNDIILVVTYTFTNNSGKAASFDFSISDKAFQNGIETGAVYSRYGIEDDYDFETSSREIQPGITLDVQEAYELSDTSSDVIIEISELFSFKEDKLTYTVELDQLD